MHFIYESIRNELLYIQQKKKIFNIIKKWIMMYIVVNKDDIQIIETVILNSFDTIIEQLKDE